MLFTAGLLLILTAAVNIYVAIGHWGGERDMQQDPGVTPGALAGVTYGHSGGSVARADFSITLSPEAIVETFYYPVLDPGTAKEEDWYHPSVKENVPITAEQWADVEQIVLELYPLMKPAPEQREVKLPSWLDVEDGVGASTLILVWDTENSTQSIRYYMPNDRRVHTLIALLQELADPVGREIPRFDPPELVGFYISYPETLFSKEYSFQLDRGPSIVYGEDAPYILRARLTLPGQNRVIWRDWTVTDAVWDDFAAFVRETGREEQPDGRSEKPHCTLYYSGGAQKGKKLDKQTAEQVRDYLTELTMQLLEEEA